MSASPFTSETRISGQSKVNINTLKLSNFSKTAIFFDVFVSVATTYSTCFFYYFILSHTGHAQLSFFGPAFVSAVYILLRFSSRAYVARENFTLKPHLQHVLMCWSGAFTFLVIVYFSAGVGFDISHDWLAAAFLIGLVSLPLGRIGAALKANGDLVEPQAFFRNVYMISAERDAAAATAMHTAFEEGLRIVGVSYLSDYESQEYSNENCEVLVEEIRHALKDRDISEIYLHFPHGMERIRDLSAALARLPIRVLLIRHKDAAESADPHAIRLGDHVAVELLSAPISARGLVAKRTLDIAVASAALFFLLPVIVMACLGIAIESGRPIIFRQNRKGVAGLPFTIFKLRTMSVQENGDKIVQACRNDPRVTRLGAVLRRTSIDELPQLFNVLRGDMSIVGPRPHALAHDTYYGALIKEYPRRHNVKPGLTGWAQVNGFRGETKDLHAMSERVRHDIWYIENWSIWLDIRIIFKTAGCVLLQKQAY
jgi:Undecaprenyl-phosphate glucose phosphotransferase